MWSADWASVYVNAAAAIGTIGAFVVGFVLLRREQNREAARDEDTRRSQAVKVSAWVEAEFIGLVPPGQTIQRPAPREWLATYYAPEPVEIEFLDSSGRQWIRNEQGLLAPTGDKTPTLARRWFRLFRQER